jgi:hypothetical protein
VIVQLPTSVSVRPPHFSLLFDRRIEVAARLRVVEPQAERARGVRRPAAGDARGDLERQHRARRHLLRPRQERQGDRVELRIVEAAARGGGAIELAGPDRLRVAVLVHVGPHVEEGPDVVAVLEAHPHLGRVEAEKSFRRALGLARRLRARSFELRATMSLASLWKGLARHRAAREA